MKCAKRFVLQILFFSSSSAAIENIHLHTDATLFSALLYKLIYRIILVFCFWRQMRSYKIPFIAMINTLIHCTKFLMENRTKNFLLATYCYRLVCLQSLWHQTLTDCDIDNKNVTQYYVKLAAVHTGIHST